MSVSGDENLNRFQSNWSSFNDQNLRDDVRRSLEQIYYLKIDLNLTDQCILKAIEFARAFLTKYFDGKYHSALICQTSLFLACKCEDRFRSSENIYEHTTKVFHPLTYTIQPGIETFKKDLFDCEEYMICKLGFEKLFWDLSKCIKETVNKIPDDTLTRGRKYELARIAGVLVEGSIAMKPICLEYTSDLIAHFCVHLAIEVQKYQFPPDIWVKDAITFEQVQSLMEKYSSIFSQRPSLFQKTFGNERSLYIKVNAITSAHVDQLNRLSFYWSIHPEQYSPRPELANSIIESNATIDMSASSTQPPPCDLREQTSHTDQVSRFMETNGNSTSDAIDEHIRMNRPNDNK